VRAGAAREIVEAPLDTRASADARLVGKPSVRRAADGVRIRFEVTKPVDVEVAVLRADGEVVRHLAAGLLGPNAPAPFQKDRLKQEIAWDGRDDAGNAVPNAAGCRVRVRVGITPKLEKTLGQASDLSGGVVAFTVGPKSELYVLESLGGPASGCVMRVLDRDGNLLRTIMPYPATTPPERTESVGHLTVDGDRVPIVFNGHAKSLYPLIPNMPKQTMAWNPRGFLIAASATDSAYEFGLPRHLLAFDPQGGAPAGISFVGPQISIPVGMYRGLGRSLYHRFDHIACSPDGKFIYYTGNDLLKGNDYYAQPSRHAVFRFTWDEDKGAGMEEPFFGEDSYAGDDDQHLNEPRGLAVDAKGSLYICDRGNHRVVIVSPEGKLIGKLAVQDPEQVAVHPKTGEIYLLSRQRSTRALRRDHAPMFGKEFRAWRKRAKERWLRREPRRPAYLRKFSAWSKNAAPNERIVFQKEFDLMALDAGVDPPRLWVSVKGTLDRLEDKGDAFEPAPVKAKPATGLHQPGNVVADPANNRVLVWDGGRARAIDLTTGALRPALAGVRDLDIAPDGTFCAIRSVRGKGLVMQRLDPKGLVPVPFTPGGPTEVKIGRYGTKAGPGRTLSVAPNGDIYILGIAGGHGVQSRVDVYRPDGTLKQARLIDGLGIGDCGIGVDVRGNVYLGVNTKPSDARLPKVFRGQVPEANWLCWVQWTHQFRPPPWYYTMRNEYLYHYGAVMKFGPEGGTMYGRSPSGSEAFVQAKSNAKGAALARNAPPGSAEYRSGYLYHRVRIDGATWRFAGTGIVPASERYWGDPSCVCLFSRLDVDPYGRVFAPDCFQFRVHVLDANGNRITGVGRYGTVDDTDETIRFAWPAFVDTAADRLFVSDALNRRVVVVQMEYADEAEAGL
jgi:hypothetical protein